MTVSWPFGSVMLYCTSFSSSTDLCDLRSLLDAARQLPAHPAVEIWMKIRVRIWDASNPGEVQEFKTLKPANFTPMLSIWGSLETNEGSLISPMLSQMVYLSKKIRIQEEVFHLVGATSFLPAVPQQRENGWISTALGIASRCWVGMVANHRWLCTPREDERQFLKSFL